MVIFQFSDKVKKRYEVKCSVREKGKTKSSVRTKPQTNSGRPCTKFPRKLSKEKTKQPLSRKISERKLKRSQKSVKRNKSRELETFRTQNLFRYGYPVDLPQNIILQALNPLHPNISMHILHSVLYTFLKGRKRRICLTVKSSLVVNHFPWSH